MLQWMGGSRKKVTTSRMSTQKRQKQYFEQRKRQQQNLQMMGSDNCSDNAGISGQNPKEHRSLDILNLLNLSTNAQKCNASCLKGRDDGENNVFTMPGSISSNQPTTFANVDTTVDSFIFGEARADLCSQIETSPKKVLASSPNQKNAALNGLASQSKTVTDQYSELSIIDLLCDDEPNASVEKCPTCEDHVSFSLEGLGKVGSETPVHSPEQQARIPCCYAPLLKDRRKSKLKNLDHVLDDIELEVDTMMQDIKVSPVNSSNFPFNKVKQSSAIAGDCEDCYDHANKNVSSVSEEFFYTTENIKEGIWNAGSSFLDEQFDNEEGFDTSWKKTFQMGSRSTELFQNGAYKMGSYASEDLPLKKWSSAAAMREINMSEPPASFSKDQLENDFDFYMPRGARCSRLYGNFNAQNLVPEDVRDNSSLLSDESSSSTAVRGEAIKHSSSRIVAEENRRNHRNAFASTRNKCSATSKEEKCRSMSNPSKRKSSHCSSSILQEELGARNSWQSEERCVSADRSSVATSFCQDLEANFAVLDSKNKVEDPFSVFTAPELHNKANASSGGFKKAAPLADSPPYNFTSSKFAFACSNAFPDAGSWPISPSLSPDFQFKGKPQDAADFHWETSSTDMSVQGSVSRGERKVKLRKNRHNTFEQREHIFMGDNELSLEKKMERGASNSNNQTQECEGTEDTNPKTIECLETADSPSHVEEISSSLKKTTKHESQVDKIKSNCDVETPLKYEITEAEMKNWQPEGRNTVGGKQNNEHISLSGQVMFESCVFQLLCVQKVLKEACTSTTSRRNNAFLGPGSGAIFHQT